MAASPSPSPILLLLIFLAIITIPCSSISSEQVGKVGGRTEIKDVKSNTEVQNLGKFSVDEFNKSHHTHLSFSQVVKAQRQVVAGIQYFLRIQASDNGVSGEYDAVVVVKAWLHSKEVVSFKPATK